VKRGTLRARPPSSAPAQLPKNEVAKCDNNTFDGINIHICECRGDLCNKNFQTADDGGDHTDPPSDTIKCYQCDSNEDDCSTTNFGQQIDCPAVDGCLISYETNKLGPNTYLRDCAGEEPRATGKEECQRTDTDNMELRYCVCMTDLCNEDWQQAGSTTVQPEDTTTSSSGDTIKCYTCNSHDPESTCTDTEHDEKTIDCPAKKGCRIARVDEPIRVGSEWVRDCSLEEKLGCQVYHNEDGGVTESCSCGTELCNADWTTAGSTTTGKGDSTTPAPTTPSSGQMLVASLTTTLAFLATLLSI